MDEAVRLMHGGGEIGARLGRHARGELCGTRMIDVE